MRSAVIDGAVIEPRAMVAAGAMVTPFKRVRSGELWAGSPAKLMRSLSAEEIAGFAYSAEHYCRLAESHRR
jgi:gamma-carbonic anhydrase